MPFEFVFDSINQVLGCWFRSLVNDDEFTRMSLATARYLALTRPRAGLSDTTAITSWEVTHERLRMIANRPPVIAPLGRHRVVIAPANDIFDMLRMFAKEAEITRPKLHIVRTMDEARTILHVQKFQFGPIPEAGPR